MSAQDNVKVVQQAYASFQSGDMAALLSTMSADVDWRPPTIAGVPFAHPYRGSEEVVRFFADIAELQQARTFEPREFIASADQVVALGYYHWRVKATGRQFASEFAHAFTVRAGRITSFREYTDTAAMASAYEAQVAIAR
jgi:ketosteroid isomerase-like protein